MALKRKDKSDRKAASAKFQIEPAAGGTRVTVELVVESGLLGSALSGISGNYDRQIRQWLEDIRWQLHADLVSSAQAAGSAELATAGPLPS